MNKNYTQPEEIDQILKTMGWHGIDVGAMPADKNPFNEARQEYDHVGLGYISPYQAAYKKSHDFIDQ